MEQTDKLLLHLPPQLGQTRLLLISVSSSWVVEVSAGNAILPSKSRARLPSWPNSLWELSTVVKYQPAASNRSARCGRGPSRSGRASRPVRISLCRIPSVGHSCQEVRYKKALKSARQMDLVHILHLADPPAFQSCGLPPGISSFVLHWR